MFIWLTGLVFQLVAFNVLPLHQLSPAHIFPDGFCHELWAGYKKHRGGRMEEEEEDHCESWLMKNVLFSFKLSS